MDKISITKLNGSNYQIWKFKLKLLLIKEDVWDVVKDELPENPDAAWCKRDGKAMAWIGLLIEDNQLCHITNAETAKAAWNALKNCHEKATLTNKIYILKRLCRIQLKEGGNMEDHINIILDMVNNLSALGENLKENLVVALLLVSLPDSYDSLITALETRPENELTLEMVKGKLISDFKRKLEANYETKDSSMMQSVAMTAKKQAYEPRICYGCGKTGHFIQQCKNVKKFEKETESNGNFKKVESQKSKKVSQDPDSDSDHSEEDEDDHIAFMVSNKDDDNNWYIDSAATSNMANKMSLFTKFNPNCHEPVTLANGVKTSSKGIGEIEITCFNELGEPQKAVMKKVLFVPDLDSCLISVQKLTKRGYKVIFEKHICFIFRNDKIIATGNRYKNLYKLNCQFKNENLMGGKNFPNFTTIKANEMGRKILHSSEIQISLFDNDIDENTKNIGNQVEEKNEIDENNENGGNQFEEEIEIIEDNINRTGEDIEVEINENENNLDETIIHVDIEVVNRIEKVGVEEDAMDQNSVTTIKRRSERPNKGKPPTRHSVFKIIAPNYHKTGKRKKT